MNVKLRTMLAAIGLALVAAVSGCGAGQYCDDYTSNGASTGVFADDDDCGGYRGGDDDEDDD